jgi:hypothetical protein
MAADDHRDVARRLGEQLVLLVAYMGECDDALDEGCSICVPAAEPAVEQLVDRFLDGDDRVKVGQVARARDVWGIDRRQGDDAERVFWQDEERHELGGEGRVRRLDVGRDGRGIEATEEVG